MLSQRLKGAETGSDAWRAPLYHRQRRPWLESLANPRGVRVTWPGDRYEWPGQGLVRYRWRDKRSDRCSSPDWRGHCPYHHLDQAVLAGRGDQCGDRRGASWRLRSCSFAPSPCVEGLPRESGRAVAGIARHIVIAAVIGRSAFASERVEYLAYDNAPGCASQSGYRQVGCGLRWEP